MSKYSELVKKFKKEEEGDSVELSKKYTPIMKSKLEAKIKALEAQEMEQGSALKEAEEEVERAKALVTKDIEKWNTGVNMSEAHRDVIAEELAATQNTIEIYNKRLDLFV